MASLKPNAACFPTLPPHQGYAQLYPFRPNTGSTTAPYICEVDQTTVLTALHRRIAVLETQLTQAYTGKQQADHAAQYLLHMVAKDHGAIAYPTVDREDIQRLRRKLRRSQEENFELRLKLHKTIMLWGNNVRTQMAAPEAHASTPVDNGHRPTYPKACAVASCSAQTNSENTLVDLLDCLSVDNLPELDDSNGESEVDDDLDSPNSHTRSLPQINLGAYGDCVIQDARNESFTGIFEQSGSAYVRHFASEDSTTIERTDPTTDKPKEEIAVTIPTPSKAKIAIPSPGIYTERDILARKAGIHNDSLFPVKKSPVINPQDVNCGPDKLFSSAGERHTAIQINRNVAGPEDLRFPDLFRYGIHYMPSLQQSNTLRTISIMNLPPEISRSKLLSSIRGGIIVSVDLLDTMSITGAFSALVVFLHGQDALAFIDFVAETALYFSGQKACVKLLTTPSWPLSLSLNTAIFQHHHTRCLELFNYPRSITPAMLRKDLRLHQALTYDAIERIQMRPDNVLEIRFLSIQAAGKAYGKLTSMRTYKQCRVVFAKDPCSLPLGNLQSKDGAIITFQLSAPSNEQMMGCKVAEPDTAQQELLATSTMTPDVNKPRCDLHTSVWAPHTSYLAPINTNNSDSTVPSTSELSQARVSSRQLVEAVNGQRKVFVPAQLIEAKELANGGFTTDNFTDAIPNQQSITGDATARDVSPAKTSAADERIFKVLPLGDLPHARPSRQMSSDRDTKFSFVPTNPMTIHRPANEPPSTPELQNSKSPLLNASENISGSITDVDVKEYLDEHMNEIDRWEDVD